MAGCLRRAPPDQEAFEALLWFGALVLAILLAVAIVGCLRRRIRASRLNARPSFTLNELRRLRDRGELTPSEYAALRRGVVEGQGDAAAPDTARYVL